MSTIHLYELTSSLSELWDQASYVLDAAPDEAARDATLSELEAQLKTLEGTHHEKCLNLACLIKSVDAEAEAVKAEEVRLKARRQSCEKKAEWLKAYLANNMEPGVNLKDGRATISWRKSQAVEVDVKPEELPEGLRRVKTVVEADKEAIKAALAAGHEVPGCQLVQRFNLQIK